MDKNTERKLIEKAKIDPIHFGPLFDAYYPKLFGYILKRVGDPAVAQDLVSETFYKALQNLGRFTWQGHSISSWLYKIALNELRMFYRKTKYTPASIEQLFEESGLEIISDYDLEAELIEAQEALQRHQDYVRVQKLILTLPLKYQEAITLRYGEQLPVADIALILNKKEGTIKSLLSRGISRLQKSMIVETQPNKPRSIIRTGGSAAANLPRKNL